MLLILAFLYILQRFTQSGAAPLSINFARQTTIDSLLSRDCVCPDVRSVWDIVWSCLVTIFACSWVSVHPNITGKNGPWRKKYLHRLELMAWAIIAPELLLNWAMRQWLGARRLAKKYKGAYITGYQFDVYIFTHGVEKGWTKTHGYFIQMGGFMLYDTECKKPIGVLYSERLEKLLEEEQIDMPTIDEEDIQDRSKGDGLTKALVIAQTTWFIMQCIARRVQGLVVTELELVTLAFATLNSVMYFLWWNKPLDVESTCPVYLKRARVEGENNGEKGSYNKLLVAQKIPSHLLSLDKILVESEVITNDNQGGSNQGMYSILDNNIVLKFICIEAEHEGENSAASPMCNTNISDLPRQLCWFLCGILYRWPFAGAIAILTRMDEIMSTTYVEQRQMHVKPFHADSNPGVNQELGLAAGVGFIGALFGAIHCAGWNFSFPSIVEASIWRASSSIITGVPGIAAIIFGYGFLVNNFDLKWELGWELKWRPGRGLEKLLEWLLLGLMLGPLLIYIFARLTLLVEALISLRDLPTEALVVVKWTLFLPHV